MNKAQAIELLKTQAIELLKTQAIELLKIHANNSDQEEAHYDADMVLCKLLTELGYVDVVNEWHKIEKWYA
jgi:hypothetical protein